MDGPTLAFFSTTFLYGIVGIPSQYLPSDAPVITFAYNFAIATVSQVFTLVPSWQTPNTQLVYGNMVYSLAAHNVLMWAPDVPNLYYQMEPPPPIGYFAWLRQNMGLNSFTAGVVSSTFDQGTGVSLEVPESLKNLTIADLELTKTPWGRQYLGLAQAWNRPWGIS